MHLGYQVGQAKKKRDLKSSDIWKAKIVRFQKGVKPGIKTNDFRVGFMHLDQESYTTHNLISHYNDALFVQKLDKCRVITLSICIIFKIGKLFYNVQARGCMEGCISRMH